MTTVRLDQSVQVRFDGSGNGTAKIGPISHMETWHPENVHVQASSHINEAVCNIYAGPDSSATNFRDGTFSGSSGDSTDRVNADIITIGSYIFAVWSGGDANAIGTLTVTGSRDV